MRGWLFIFGLFLKLNRALFVGSFWVAEWLKSLLELPSIDLNTCVCVCLCSEDSCEDVMSSGEECLSSSLGSDAEEPFFPLHLRLQKHRQHLPAWYLHVPHRPHPPNKLCILMNFSAGGESHNNWQLSSPDSPGRFARFLVCRYDGGCWDVTFQVFKDI